MDNPNNWGSVTEDHVGRRVLVTIEVDKGLSEYRETYEGVVALKRGSRFPFLLLENGDLMGFAWYTEVDFLD